MKTEGQKLTAHDVAKYILEVYQDRFAKPMSVMKLHKLIYYAQAWSLVWDDEKLFPERIEAWAYGPVVPDLYRIHKGFYELSKWSRGDSSRLTADQKETIEQVVTFYGHKSATWLSDLSHREAPWREARAAANLGPGERGNAEITPASLADYYERIYSERI